MDQDNHNNLGLYSLSGYCKTKVTRPQGSGFYPRPVLASGYCHHLCLCVSVCINHLHDNSPVQARITKFGPKKQDTLVKILIVLRGDWPWPSRSNLTSNSKLTPFWACPNDYSPPIQVRISKFGPQMHFSTVKIFINSGLNWPWTSLSFLFQKLISLHCGGVHWDCETVPGLFQCCSSTVSVSLPVHMETVQPKWNGASTAVVLNLN